MRFNKKIYRGFLILLTIVCFSNVHAQETEIMIRAQAKDAKFIGTSIGGAKIIVKDAVTGEILAEGKTSGSTGNTELIMKQPHERYQQLTDESTAGFVAGLDIEKPTFVSIEAHAPMNQKQAKVVTSTQLWVIPGKDITGDGVVLEIPGFVVGILSPQVHERINSENEIEIKANIVMMCGCPITEGGTWDANQYEVKALVSKEGEQVGEIVLNIQDKPSTFTGKVNLEPGYYEILVYAFDPITGNTGVDKTNIVVN